MDKVLQQVKSAGSNAEKPSEAGSADLRAVWEAGGLILPCFTVFPACGASFPDPENRAHRRGTLKNEGPGSEGK